jgi:hypothetical protein
MKRMLLFPICFMGAAGAGPNLLLQVPAPGAADLNR